MISWHVLSPSSALQIFHYDYPTSTILHEDFASRLEWGGTKGTADLQIGAIYIRNVSFNDTGTYTCTFERTLSLPHRNEHVTITKTVELTVLAEGNALTSSLCILQMLLYLFHSFFATHFHFVNADFNRLLIFNKHYQTCFSLLTKKSIFYWPE